jgi:DNA replication and repair protein RecF
LYLKEIGITNFRNYKEGLSLIFSHSNNLFLGYNAQGKSNLLEAIYYLSLAHSFRGARDMDLINFEKDFFRLEGRIIKRDREQDICITYSRDRTKHFIIDGVKGKSLNDIIGQFTCVIFAPEHLQLVKGPPALRRKYLDTQISQIVPRYYQNLRDYKRIVRQRNEILKNRQEEQLLLWDNYLCKAGTKIIEARLRAVKKLTSIVRDSFFKISGEDTVFEVNYCSTLGPLECLLDEKSIFERYREKLTSKREMEFRTCATMVGPHRDDLLMLLDGKPLKDFGSQGQQRMAVISLKMAELNFIKTFTGEYPVFLLDDVMSELDSRRRKYVVDLLTQVQTFITGTDRDQFDEEFLKGVAIKNIRCGKIY